MSIDLHALLGEVADRSQRVHLADPVDVRRIGDRRARRRRLQLAAGLVLVAALATGVGRALIDRDADPKPVQPVPSPTPTQAPTPAPTRSPTTEAGSGGPTTYPIETGPYRFSVRAIAVRDGRFVVVGDSSELGADAGPPVYWSDDAVQWRAPSATGAPDSVNVTDVIATDEGFLAVGLGADGPAAWWSTDGRTWVPSAVDAPGRGGADMLWGLTSTHLGYFAWGYDGGHAGLWRSTDGRTWSPAGDQAVFDLPHDEAICAIRESGDGPVAAGVVTPRNSSEGHRVTWASADGSEWVLAEGHGPTFWCDPPKMLGHLEARSPGVGRVRIEPNGEGNEVFVGTR